jgi:DNA-binding GntR family transcriptional regulator
MREETSSIAEFRSHALDRHAAILRAVAAGDPQAARTAMEAHLDQTEQDVERYLSPQAAGRPTG